MPEAVGSSPVAAVKQLTEAEPVPDAKPVSTCPYWPVIRARWGTFELARDITSKAGVRRIRQPHPARSVRYIVIQRDRTGPRLAGELGFEPRQAESESAVLPLDDSPKDLLIRPPLGGRVRRVTSAPANEASGARYRVLGRRGLPHSSPESGPANRLL